MAAPDLLQRGGAPRLTECGIHLEVRHGHAIGCDAEALDEGGLRELRDR
jgi:hypothetical protein